MEKMYQYLYLKVVSAATFSKKYFLYLKIHLQKVYYQYFQIRQKKYLNICICIGFKSNSKPLVILNNRNENQMDGFLE